MASASTFKITLSYQTPQAGDDTWSDGNEDLIGYISINDLLANDLGGTATTFYGIDQTDPRIASLSAYTMLGAELNVLGDGTISYDPTGDLALAIQQLAAGETIEDTFTYTIRLSSGALSTATVTVTVTGENDVAVLGGVSFGDVTEDASPDTLTTSGALTITDVDSGQANFIAQAGTTGSNGYGTFSLDAAGNWTYSADNTQAAIQQLGAGETLTDSFTAVSSDGSASEVVTVTIHGTNDVAVLGGVSSGDVTEDASPDTLTTSGALTITDVDSGQANFIAQAGTTGSNGYGTFSLDAAGNWTYSADNTQAAIQQLGAGETLTDSFTAVSSDGSASEVVTVTIHGQDDGPFGFYPVRQYSAPGTGVWALTAGDFNGDGSNDIAVTTFLSQSVYTMLNDSSGALLTTASVATSRPGPIETADLNGDGKLDLVTGNAAGASVTILMGNGDGTFGGPVNFVTHGNIRGIAIGDVDGDGKLDIASSNSDGFVSVLLGNGDGTFQTQTAYLAGSNPLSIALGDINGDGSLDMVTGNESANTVSVFLNQGDGTFQFTSLLSPAASTPQDVELADMNGDGNIDLVVACRNGNAVSISLGNGDGTFANAVAYAAGLQTSDVAVGDLNGDGYLDVAAANINTSDISVLLGNGDGTFQSQFTFVVGLNPGPIEIVDLNGDGKLDIAGLTSGSFSISELLNTGNWDMII